MKRWLDYHYAPQIIVFLIIAIALGSYRYFAYHDTYSSDSYVSANVININALVSGPISALYIKDNQTVRKNQVLIQIDPRPYRYALNQAQAELAIAKKNHQNERLNIKLNQQKLDQARLSLALFRNHYRRFKKLVALKAIPELKLIDLSATIREQEAAVATAELSLEIAQKNLDRNPIKRAQAKLDSAQYLYNHTALKAPADGVVTNFNLRQGQFINAYQGLFALIETDKWWVVTRYRETELRLVKPGDKAKITIDMYPGKTFHGHVESIGWGINRVQSGNVAPSTLSYLEATEDWIKIAQRFPVRILIDDLPLDTPLRIGASATSKTYPNA